MYPEATKEEMPSVSAAIASAVQTPGRAAPRHRRGCTRSERREPHCLDATDSAGEGVHRLARQNRLAEMSRRADMDAVAEAFGA
jgi:hypothetical protein